MPQLGGLGRRCGGPSRLPQSYAKSISESSQVLDVNGQPYDVHKGYDEIPNKFGLRKYVLNDTKSNQFKNDCENTLPL